MALKYSDEYPSQVDTDAAYPQGKARNVSVPGAGDGTPWNADLVNDLMFGPWQAMLKLTGTVPSGSPDTASSSQYMEALARWIWGTLIASNWTVAAQGSEHYNAVCYNPDDKLWVAVGENGKVLVTNGWSSSTSTIAGNPNLNGVCWAPNTGGGLFIACGDGGTMYTMDPDVGTWTARNSETTDDLVALAVKPGSPDTIVAVASTHTDVEIVYSTDGTNWTAAAADAGYNRHSVCWSADLGIFVCGHSSGLAETSADGVTWTSPAATVSNYIMHDVVWSVTHQKFIGACNAGRILTSPDGIVWTEVASLTGTPTLYGVTVDETLGQVYVVGSDGIWSSFDLATWYNRLDFTAIDIRAASFSAGRGQTMLVGDDGLTMFSLRGLHA